MKTLQQITAELAQAGLGMSARNVRRHLRSAGLKPLSKGLRPVLWPEDAPTVVLHRSGFAPKPNGRIYSLADLAALQRGPRRGRKAPSHE